MTNIPTDLLRTLVAVVDLRSVTKAAGSLGLTQPAVSAQIKRLQFLLGGDLFDRTVQGLSLTPQGEMVVSYARRLLSINDQIVDLGGGSNGPELVVHIGTSSDYVASLLPSTLVRFRERRPDVRFIVRTDYYDPLVRELRAGALDLVVGLSLNPPPDAYHAMTQEVVWVRGVPTRLDLDRPIPLISYGESCTYHRLAVTALNAAGLDWNDVFTGPSVATLGSAVAVGLGVTAVTRRLAADIGMIIWEDAPLPKLPDLYSGIYVREGGDRSAYERLANDIAATLHVPPLRAPKLVSALSPTRKANPAA
jgi:DNA-binding transcriptional LysR family regulator